MSGSTPLPGREMENEDMATHAETSAHDHDEPHHPYHLVDPSPWPFTGALAAFVLVVGAAMWMHESAVGMVLTIAGLLGVLATMVLWWRDVLRESRGGSHTQPVASGLRTGVVLFIVSEVFFFIAFFWAYFWGALVQPETMATSWPPEGVHSVPVFGIPLLNTLLLLLSGTTLTWAHHEVRQGNNQVAFQALLLTVALGATFLGFQVYEYIEVMHGGLTLQAGVYGSTFFMATGFHGFHVFVGAVFLVVCTVRAARLRLNAEKHVGFEAAAWYWHFVDVVWLFLFVCVYMWGATHHVVTTPEITVF